SGQTRGRWTGHSCFDGEGVQQREGKEPENGVSEGGPLLWARGMARPFMKEGESGEYPLLTSLETARGKHIPLAWIYQKLSKDAKSQNIRVPAGSFEVEVLRETRKDNTWRAYYVEKASPKRV